MNSGLQLKCISKCLGIFPKNQEGDIDFRNWVKRVNNQHLLILLNLCVVWCGSVKCSFSVCSVICLFSCLAVNNCIGNMLDFPEFLHLARRFFNQSDCRTFQSSILKRQAILNMYLDIIEGIEILGTNESIKWFCLVMLNSGMPPTLYWPIKIQDSGNSNNPRKVLVAKLFFAYGYVSIGITYQCIFLSRLCLWIYIHRSHISM